MDSSTQAEAVRMREFLVTQCGLANRGLYLQDKLRFLSYKGLLEATESRVLTMLDRAYTITSEDGPQAQQTKTFEITIMRTEIARAKSIELARAKRHADSNQT